MSKPAVEFYFDFMSPYAYLANAELGRMAREGTVELRLHPFDLPALMSAVGNSPTTLQCANKGKYVMRDVMRWAKKYGVPLAGNPAWTTFDFGELGRGALVAIAEGNGPAYVDAIFHANFGAPEDLSKRAVRECVLARAGLSPAILDRAADLKNRYAEATAAAAERGVFGAPSIFVGDELFFGNDRLDFVAQALEAGHAR